MEFFQPKNWAQVIINLSLTPYMISERSFDLMIMDPDHDFIASKKFFERDF